MEKIGRTTRMLKEAIRLTMARQRVYIVAANQQEVSRLRKQLSEMADGTDMICVGTPDSLRFDWELRSAPGLSDCTFLVDHFTIQCRR